METVGKEQAVAAGVFAAEQAVRESLTEVLPEPAAQFVAACFAVGEPAAFAVHDGHVKGLL